MIVHRIVSVPERHDMARSLVKALRGQGAKDVEICSDIRYTGSWNGTRRAWESGLKTDATHILNIEEDAQPCRNFVQAVERIATFLPEHVVAFYSLKRESHLTRWAQKRDMRYYVTDGYASGVAVLMSRELALDFLRWTDAFIDPKTRYEDTRLTEWQRVRGIHTWTTVPNLVQHLGATRSSLGFSNPGKTSACWIEDADPLEMDWTPPANPEVHAGMKNSGVVYR